MDFPGLDQNGIGSYLSTQVHLDTKLGEIDLAPNVILLHPVQHLSLY